MIFVEQGLRLLNKQGRLNYILPHKFFNAKYGEPIREVVSQGKHLSKIVHFGDEQIFDEATTYVCLLFLDRSPNETFEFYGVENIFTWSHSHDAVKGSISAKKASKLEWNFIVGSESLVFDKLNDFPTKLEHVTDRIFQGVKTSADKIYIVEELERTDSKVKVYSSQDEAEHWLESDLLHPLIKGGDSKAYQLSKRRG